MCLFSGPERVPVGRTNLCVVTSMLEFKAH